MTLDEISAADAWSNEEYFDYMKETGNWDGGVSLGLTGRPCDRCNQDDLASWTAQAIMPCDDGSSIATEFEICTLCMLELYGATCGNLDDTLEEDEDDEQDY